jgi:hypothetical protein
VQEEKARWRDELAATTARQAELEDASGDADGDELFGVASPWAAEATAAL